MAGFLDSNERILDVILTAEGRRRLAAGDLSFSYFALFDDEVDYSPYVSQSGSMSSAQLSSSIDASIEETPVREACSGYRYSNPSGSDFTNVRSGIFTVPQGQRVVPRMAVVTPSSSIPVTVSVSKETRLNQQVFSRQSPAAQGLDLSVNDGRSEGFLVRVFVSGSDGLSEMRPRFDSSGDLVYDAGLKLVVD